MSLLYDEGQTAIGEESRRVLDAKAKPERLLQLLEEVGTFDEVYWNLCKEQGWTAITLPESAGGLGLGLVELGLVALAGGAHAVGAPFLNTSFGAAQALLAGSDAEAGAQWAPKLASGEAIGAIAFAEGQAPLPARSAVVFEGGKLTGRKPAVTGGLHADIAIVLASEGGAPVLVAAPLAGVERVALATFDNTRCAANLVFAGAPATALAKGDAALAAARNVLALQAVVTAHEQVGGAEAMMVRARDYANTRKAFGQPIGAFQSVKHRIAELYGLVELARANAVHAASLAGTEGFVTAAAAARLSATEAYDTAARDCVQVHGGIGVTWEGGIHLHMRRARTLAVEQGNALFWEDVLVDNLLGEAA